MEINFSKYSDGLIPAIVQDSQTNRVLMLGFMNQEALDKSHELGKLTFSAVRKTGFGPKGKKAVIS